MADAGTITVLITGFGPYPRSNGGTYQRNASHEISKLLPSIILPKSRFNPSNCTIKLLNPTAEDGAHVRVEYAYIRLYTSALHTSHAPDTDLILHIGQADGWDFISVERRAYKQGFSSDWTGSSTGKLGGYYFVPDAAGKTVMDAGSCPWDGDVPVGLSTRVDVDAVVSDVDAVLDGKGRKVRAHDDPGTYCCGFMFYESLANKFVKHTPADVMFCHVPSDMDAASLEAGRDSILAIIGASVSNLFERRSKDRRTLLLA